MRTSRTVRFRDGHRNGRGRTREQEAKMARFRLRALRRALTPNTHTTDHVHFHTGPAGQPAACFDDACRMPRLDVA